MPCPFRVVLILVSAVIALAAAILALHSSTEIDDEGNVRPTRSIVEAMGDFYEAKCRPWLPQWAGGLKRVEDEAEEDEVEEEAEQVEGHTKAE